MTGKVVFINGAALTARCVQSAMMYHRVGIRPCRVSDCQFPPGSGFALEIGAIFTVCLPVESFFAFVAAEMPEKCGPKVGERVGRGNLKI